MKGFLKKIPLVRAAYQCARPLVPGYSGRLFRDYLHFWRTFREYKRMHGSAPCRLRDLWVEIGDWRDKTPVSFYFYQDTWAFRKIVQARPMQHVDVGSTALLVGCLASIVPTISIDVRPLPATIPGLECRRGLITDLPFLDDTVSSLSALCVIEHIGLGRYGDPVDPDGTRKAARELSRVLAPGGNLYVSAPLGRSYVAFNAHRSFAKEEFIGLFTGLRLIDYELVNDRGVTESFNPDPNLGLHVGLFHFRK